VCAAIDLTSSFGRRLSQAACNTAAAPRLLQQSEALHSVRTEPGILGQAIGKAGASLSDWPTTEVGGAAAEWRWIIAHSRSATCASGSKLPPLMHPAPPQSNQKPTNNAVLVLRELSPQSDPAVPVPRPGRRPPVQPQIRSFELK